MQGAYYNEIDPFAAQWLRNLIAAGHIAPGDVDERSIVEVRADDLRGYTQCHFFAGIGGWSYALRLAGWDDERFVWTGSCPCQPFSAAGAGKAADDERHLWPAWFPLIAERRPGVLFGEQVDAAIGWGWLDAVCADLEAEGYAVGQAILPACSVGAPHIRQRLWFVADSSEGGRALVGAARVHAGGKCGDDAVGRGSDGELGDAECEGLEGRARGWSNGTGIIRGQFGERRRASFWSDCVWLPCTDGKARPTKPGIQPLAAGVSARMGKLRAAGNAIVPQVAAEFISAVMET